MPRSRLSSFSAVAIFIALASPALTSDRATASNWRSIDLELDSSQYLSISDGDQTGLDIAGDLTIEAWVKPESTGVDRTVVAKWNSIEPQRSYALVVYNGAVSFNVSGNGGPGNQSWASTSLVTGVWQHIAVTFDTSVGGGTAIHYLDGQPDGQTSNMGTSIFDSVTPFRIGAQDLGMSHFFDGNIDEVRLWSDVRTATEIRGNRFVQLIGCADDLVAYWSFDGDLLDDPCNDNDLTNVNGASFSTNVLFPPVPAISIRSLLAMAAVLVGTGIATRRWRSVRGS